MHPLRFKQCKTSTTLQNQANQIETTPYSNHQQWYFLVVNECIQFLFHSSTTSHHITFKANIGAKIQLHTIPNTFGLLCSQASPISRMYRSCYY